jgi:hypothetical protein
MEEFVVKMLPQAQYSVNVPLVKITRVKLSF